MPTSLVVDSQNLADQRLNQIDVRVVALHVVAREQRVHRSFREELSDHFRVRRSERKENLFDLNKYKAVFIAFERKNFLILCQHFLNFDTKFEFFMFKRKMTKGKSFVMFVLS